MKPRRMLAFLAVLLLTGCGILELSIEQPTGTAQPASPIQYATTSPAAANQPALPTATALAQVSDPPSPTDTSPVEISDPLPPTDLPPEQAAPTSTGPQMVKIFLIAVGDNGVSGDLIGCGDSAVPVQVQITPTQGVLKAAFLSLLSIKTRDYGESGLYNALYQSNLQLDSVKIENGTAVIYLSGSLLLGGECDNPRVEAELTRTALQFSTVQQVSIFINNRPLKDVLSLK
jgi:hypothetical protein